MSTNHVQYCSAEETSFTYVKSRCTLLAHSSLCSPSVLSRRSRAAGCSHTVCSFHFAPPQIPLFSFLSAEFARQSLVIPRAPSGHATDKVRPEMTLIHLPVVVGLLLCLVRTCHVAFSKFETHCSLPSTSVNCMSSPESRGTLDILWSSLFTLFTCTWTIQYLNVPEQQNRASDNGFWANVSWTLKGFWSTAKWMIVTMLAPEYILGKSFNDLWVAMLSRVPMQNLAKEDKVEWSLSHSFLADMGGFVGVAEDEPVDENGHVNKLNACPLTAFEIHWLRVTLRSGEPWTPKIEKLPDIAMAEILDKSKGDALVKIFSAGQVCWVTLQIVVRAAKGLAISQLEVAVAAVAACAGLTFLILVYKPQGVRVPLRAVNCEPGSIEEVQRPGCLSLHVGCLDDILMPPLSNDLVGVLYIWGPPPSLMAGIGIMMGGLLFGGIHFAGWRDHTFPTDSENWFWLSGSIFLMYAPAVMLILVDFGPQVFKLGIVKFVYVMVRISMWVEVFRTLSYLPPDAYISTWASSLPSVS